MPHAYLAFEGEQHGFRKSETVISCLEAELSFYAAGVRLRAGRRHGAGGDRQVGPLPSTGTLRLEPRPRIGREECSEEHDLGDDEKQHPEELGLDPRGDVGGPAGRDVVVVAPWPAATDADSIRPPLLAHDVLDGLARGGLHPPDQVGAQPAGAGLGEGRDDDVIGTVELEGVLDRRVGSGWTTWPTASSPAASSSLQRMCQPLGASSRRRRLRRLGAITMKRRGSSAPCA